VVVLARAGPIRPTDLQRGLHQQSDQAHAQQERASRRSITPEPLHYQSAFLQFSPLIPRAMLLFFAQFALAFVRLINPDLGKIHQQVIGQIQSRDGVRKINNLLILLIINY
jgi:hypothetical protein